MMNPVAQYLESQKNALDAKYGRIDMLRSAAGPGLAPGASLFGQPVAPPEVPRIIIRPHWNELEGEHFLISVIQGETHTHINMAMTDVGAIEAAEQIHSAFGGRAVTIINVG
jgi:hypothetical protein